MYDDPKVTVSHVSVGRDSLAAAPVLVGLELENINDYPLTTVHVQLALELDSLPIGALDEDSTMILPKQATSTVDLSLAPSAGMPRGRLAAIASGTHRFEVNGTAVITTPFGKREVRFAQVGDLEFEGGDSASSSSALDHEPTSTP